MGARTRTCFIIMVLQMINLISSQEVAKRVPQGFFGVKGKKYNDMDEPVFYKRRPQFFVGVKGKNSPKEYPQTNYDLYYKRAPMGFVGMRGKKDTEPNSYTSDNYDGRNPMGYPQFYDFYKRAPMGFMGMRGRRDSNEMPEPNPFVPDSYEYTPKRGSLIGQIDYNSNEEPQSDPIDFPFLNMLSEYVRQNANSNESNEIKSIETNSGLPFDDDQYGNGLTKRSAHMHQFFGVRGKKLNDAKRPFDMSFRGKFIGVRGKKDLRSSDMKEIKFLLDREGPWPKRKGQMNGFFGMRGKKWVDESNAKSDEMNLETQ